MLMSCAGGTHEFGAAARRELHQQIAIRPHAGDHHHLLKHLNICILCIAEHIND